MATNITKKRVPTATVVQTVVEVDTLRILEMNIKINPDSILRSSIEIIYQEGTTNTEGTFISATTNTLLIKNQEVIHVLAATTNGTVGQEVERICANLIELKDNE